MFYADYIPLNYDFGTSADSNLRDTVSTDDFVSMHLFDYNELFNLYSTSIDRVLTDGDWNENWHDSGKLHDTPNATNQTHDYGDIVDSDFTSRGEIINNSLIFRNAGANSLLYIVEPADQNGAVFDEFQDVEEVWDVTDPDYADNNLLNMLFNPDSDALGVTSVGDADYLFSYDEDTGVYSYSSDTSGVAYNQDDERFYVYNSPESYYANQGNDSSKLSRNLFSPFTAGTARLSKGKATNNWWFGMDMAVDFKLPDATSETGSGNVAADGEDMSFTISATDDAIVFVDDTLVLSMGGSHVETEPNSAPANTDILSLHSGTGTIDFATGEYEYYIEDNKDGSYESGTLDLSSGSHTLRVYYLQRNGVDSKLNVSFNVSDEYDNYAGTVVWDDDDDASGNRPDSVTVNLMDGDTVAKTQTVTADDDWKFNFTVDRSDGVDYTIAEDAMRGYTVDVSGSMADGFTVTNSAVADVDRDETGLYGQIEINPSNKRAYVGAVNGGGRFQAANLRNYADEDGKLTVYLPGELDMPESTGSSTRSSSAYNYFSVLNGQSYGTTQPADDGVVHLQGFTYYKLKVVGWYNVDTGDYIDVAGKSGGVETTVDLHEENVFYADYVPVDYDFGTASDANLVDTVSTSDFTTMRLFDYNELFNLYSTSIDRVLSYKAGDASSSAEWDEVWHDSGSLHDEANATNQAHDSTDVNDDDFTSRGEAINSSLIFRNKGDDSLLYITDPADQNGGVTDVFQDAADVWGIDDPDYEQNNLLNMLFNPDPDALGVTSVGDADYLFSYDDDTGVYSYDSDANAVAYNQDDERFYVYDSPEKYAGTALFSPFTGNSSRSATATNNWWYGMDMEVDFHLPSDTGADTTNVGKNGEPMFFDISANDDVLVFVDDALVLDMSGSHVESKSGSAQATSELVAAHTGTGTIDFATGEYEYYIEDNETASKVSGTIDLAEGDHTLRIYYLERSAFVSDLGISFNLLHATEDISGSKVWDDADDQDGIRPDEVTVSLLADGEQAYDDDGNALVKTVTADDDWEWTFEGLEKYIADPSADDGYREIDYTFAEDEVDGYTAEVSGSMADGFVITNTHVPDTVEASGTITWNDASNQDGLRPAYVTVQLFGQDESGGTYVTKSFEVKAPEDGGDTWTWSADDLDRYADGGKELRYSVIYTGVDSDDCTQANSGFDVTYSHTPATTEVSGSKTWNDDDDAENTRPSEITIELWADDEVVQQETVSAADGWSWSFDDLPVYANGVQIAYHVTEDSVEDYNTTYHFEEGRYDVSNTLAPGETSVTVFKSWDDADDQDGVRPSSVTVELLRNGVETDRTLTLSESDNWEGSFTGLDEYDENGVRIAYAIDEVDVSGYDKEVSGDATTGFAIANAHEPEKIEKISGTKAWDDAGDQDGIRPDEVVIHLLADGDPVDTTTADADGGWAFGFTDLDKYAGGEEIEYTVEEADVAEGYEATVEGDADGGFTITNTHEPETIDVFGSKAWDDDDDRDGIRPGSITVHLLADGEEVDDISLTAGGWWRSFVALFGGDQTVTPDADGNWNFSFTDLPKYRDGGVEIAYTVAEDAVDGYTATIEGDAEAGFEITNAHTPETVEITGIKTWDDASNQDGVRSHDVTIRLLADGDEVDSTTIDDGDDWSWGFSDMPKYRDGGTEISYRITEDEVDDYTTTIDGDVETGFTVTNAHTPELFNGDGTFKVVLVWDDEANNDGIRPNEVNVTLTKNNAEVEGASLTLTADEVDADGNWVGTFEGLDRYEAGREVSYSINEDYLSGYTYRIEVLTDDEGNAYVQLTNVHVSVKEDIQVTKVWDDADDQDGRRPDSITVRLLLNDSLYKTVTLYADTEGVEVSDGGNRWTYSLKDIPVDKNGEAVDYTLIEVDVDNYDPVIETHRGAEVTDDGVTYRPYSFTVTNAHEPETVEVPVSKVWDDADDQDGKRPGFVTVSLLADGEPIESHDLTAASDADGDGVWEWTFDNGGDGYDKYENGREIAYTVVEDAVDDYDTAITGDVASGFTITNSYEPETTAITGSKTWRDDDDADGKRPDEVTVRLHANGEIVDTRTVTADDGWAWIFDDLPVYANGHKITYLITEDELDDYDVTYDFGADGSYNLVNTLDSGETSVTVIKDWEDVENQDGKRPESVTVELMRDGEVAKDHDDNDAVITLTEADHWIGSFTKLDEYDENGVRIQYAVQEVSAGVEGYTSAIAGDMETGFVVTNSYEPETIDVTGEKTWDDAEDQDGKRPDEVTVHLLANGEPVQSATVGEADGWTWTFADLDKYANGEEITYGIVEAFVADGYEATVDGFDVVNMHAPEQIDITGTKTWDDADDQDGIRPNEVTVSLQADGEPVLDASGAPVTATATEQDGWTYTFAGYDKYADGTEIDYSVVEEEVPGYTGAYSGYDVTNSHTPEKINGDGTLGVVLRWNDEEDQDGIRPKSNTVTLTIDDEEVEGATLTLSPDNVDDEGNWIGAFTDLDKYANGGWEIAYSVAEGVMPGYSYTAELKYDDASGLYYIEITNSHAAVAFDIELTKVWDDADDQDGIRPESITVNLASNGSAVKSSTLTAETEGVEVSDDGNTWTYVFNDLPVDQNGQAIAYSLTELDVGSYTHEITTTRGAAETTDGVTYQPYAFTVTNSHEPETIDVAGSKTWEDADDQDGIRPHSITIGLSADGDEIDRTTVFPDEDDDWSWEFSDLPKYRDGGTEIEYAISEDAVAGYGTTVDGYDVVNTHVPETTEISGSKIWAVDDDAYGTRPAGIDINLYANGLVHESKTVTAADGWAWTFSDLPVYADGQKITYITTETAIDDYDTSYSGFDLRNTLDEGETSVTVVKDWEDAGDQDGVRPEDVTVELLADGADTGKTLTLSDSNDWRGSFTELDEYAEGVRIAYSVEEVDDVDDYTTTISGDAQTGFIITNTHAPETVDVSGAKAWDDADD